MPLNEIQNLVVEGLSILRDPRPNKHQPTLADGVHLRWAPGKARGFPPHGYYLFRRVYRQRGERCLADFTSGLSPGELDVKELTGPYGRLQSLDDNLFLTDDFAPTGYVEFDLARHRLLLFDLPEQVTATWVEVSIGFRPPPVAGVTHLGFDRTQAGDRDNPLVVDGVSFRALNTDGNSEPKTRIVVDREGRWAMMCNHSIEITLPCTSDYVDVARGAPTRNRISAYNADGSLASERDDGPFPFGQNRMHGEAIHRVVLEAPGGLFYGTSFWCQPAEVEIPIVALFEGNTVAEASARGLQGEIATVVIEADKLTTVWISGGPAALVELCYRTEELQTATTETAPGPWGKVRGFDAPLSLPIDHPKYPASTGSESLSTWRTRAEERILYGGADDYLSTSLRHVELGTSIRLEPGSAVVTGKGTQWDESLVGQLIYPSSLETAFAVMTVLGPDRLVLSRPFSGNAPIDAGYERSGDDTFAEIHDQLGALLSAPEGKMRQASMPPIFDRSDVDTGKRVRLSDGSDLVTGEKTSWPGELEGLLIELGGNPDVYRIEEVRGGQHLKLDRPFVGDASVGEFRIVSRSPTNEIEPDRPSLDLAPMDLLELAAFEPAYAQLLGLYWIDRGAVEGEVYDYMVLADHGGKLGGDEDAALRWLNSHPQVTAKDVDGALVREIRHRGSRALAAPRDLRGFALPAGRQRLDLDRPNLADSEPGLSVSEISKWAERPLAERPVMLQPWRLDLGTAEPDPGTIPDPESYQPLGDGPRGDRFVVSAAPEGVPIPRPEGWPDPRTIHYLDPALDIGWYAYRLHAIDLFGRYSALSEAIPWYGIAPVAEHHPYAVRLADLTPPPPPTDVVAWVLDKDDPGLIEDDAYRAWRAHSDVTPDTLGLRIRWRWPWTHLLQAPDLEEFRVYYQPTPINARPSRIVAVSPAVGDAKLSEVVLELDDQVHPADDYHGAALQTGNRSFEVVRSRPAARLELVVRNGGPLRDLRPTAGADATLVLPEGHRLHRGLLDPLNWRARLAHVHHASPDNAAVDHQVQMVTDPSVVTFDAENNDFRGTDARWDGTRIEIRDLPAGRDLTQVRPRIDVIALSSKQHGGRVLEIESVGPGKSKILPAGSLTDLVEGRYDWVIGPPEQLLEGASSRWHAASRTLTLDGKRDLSHIRPGIDLIYVEATGGSTAAVLAHYFAIEQVDEDGGWLILNDDGPGQISILKDDQSYAWKVGWPLRVYELFLSAKEAADPPDYTVAKALIPSLAEPVRYGTIGVSAADRRTEVADRRASAQKPRPGNEGQLGGPATVFRVYRERPEAPADIAWGASRLTATKADYHGKSYFTVRWAKPTDPEKRRHFKAHVFRAMDQTLYMVDFEHRQDPGGLSPTDKTTYSKIKAAPDLERAREHYDNLSDGALRVLADLERNEEAFAQITIEPLDHTDPANDDRLGPDDDADTFPGPDSNRGAFLDSMDGRSSNRYLHRVAFVDPGQNLGPMGKSLPPVYLPKVEPPRTPVITGIESGQRLITVRWTSGREPGALTYHIYRTQNTEVLHDTRLMERIASILPPAPSDENGLEFSWPDHNIRPGRLYHYRLTAIDSSGNPSTASSPVAGRAFDLTPPDPPTWERLEWVWIDTQDREHTVSDPPPLTRSVTEAVALAWTSPEPLTALVQIRTETSLNWMPATTWIEPTDAQIEQGRWLYKAYDSEPRPSGPRWYRILAESDAGNLTVDFDERRLDRIKEQP